MTTKGSSHSGRHNHLPRFRSRTAAGTEQPRHPGGQETRRGVELGQSQQERTETVYQARQERAGESRHPAPAQEVAAESRRPGAHRQQPLPAGESAEVRPVQIDGERGIQHRRHQRATELRISDCGLRIVGMPDYPSCRYCYCRLMVTDCALAAILIRNPQSNPQSHHSFSTTWPVPRVMRPML